MSMISGALITGGVFNQHIDQRQVYTHAHTHKSAKDYLQEAVAPTAFHNSGEQFDRPKCHPNTRIAVRDKIEKWALRMDPDTMDGAIMWLSGAAGAGKSAIAQTVAEDFHSKGLLAASFFFGRSDSTRNHARSLVATIVYQLYRLLAPPEQNRLLVVIDGDPLIFTKSVLVQFEALIVNPLQHIIENGAWTSVSAPSLIIIDGLDECLDRNMQRDVLLMLSASVHQFHLPFVFLLASRPEHDIQAVFNSSDFLSIHTRLFLDDTYLPDRDIELFLHDQFEECRASHPFKHMIPPGWPSGDIVKKLTRKSSGQFIYASVVVKYVKSSRHRPHHRLDIVLNLRPALRDLPFSELDALYTHLFSSVDDIERVLDVISFKIIFPTLASIDNIEYMLKLDVGEVDILLCDLSSVIGIEAGLVRQLKIFHASLADYLLDSARSKEYFIDARQRGADHVARCFQFLSSLDVQCQNPFINPAINAILCFKSQHLSVDLTKPLYNAIKGFSISRIVDLTLRMDQGHDQRRLAEALAFVFLPTLHGFLKKSDSTKYLELYQHHQFGYDLLFQENIKACPLGSATSLVFALVTIHDQIPKGAFHEPFVLVDYSCFRMQGLAAYQLNHHGYDPATDTDFVYLNYLTDVLHDPKRSMEFYAGPKLFAHAAKHCLLYLCNHAAFSQKAPPRISAQHRMRRKLTPWKWHRRFLREDIKGPGDAPWLWLRRPTAPYRPITRTPVFHRRTNDFIYIHIPHISMSIDPPDYNDPVVMHRINSEKYHLALVYLNNFLPRAGQLDELVHMCQRLTLASRSQDFLRESARARSNMKKYIAQWA